MKCVIIDDEHRAIDVVRIYSEKIPYLKLAESFTDPVEGIQYLNTNEVDLIFLDINMQGLSGFELLAALNRQPLVIFTTAYSEFAVQSYTVNAVDYLVKPINFARFIKAVNKAAQMLQKNVKVEAQITTRLDDTSAIITIKSGTIIHRIPKEEILYVESDGNYLKVKIPNEIIMTLSSMPQMLAILGEGFFQCHRSFIVAKAMIRQIETHQLVVAGHTIPIGASFRREVNKRLGNS